MVNSCCDCWCCIPWCAGQYTLPNAAAACLLEGPSVAVLSVDRSEERKLQYARCGLWPAWPQATQNITLMCCQPSFRLVCWLPQLTWLQCEERSLKDLDCNVCVATNCRCGCVCVWGGGGLLCCDVCACKRLPKATTDDFKSATCQNW